ncbi:helix-turn-helix domain-containing protein [Eubacterium barkeri]|uniref:HTH cro/C1-type domain-containing protein n=1 Tax=Eubacterium barkeri TaxID=1528 RepID=A0A1H3HHB1_EUBBA|nr:helix-turn-helix transcriptional regulator [Eubacterium barkeri]SDY14198.1 hypothetical protein SAMN04488579_11778 [Eubacterium barkeri]
MLNTKKIKGRMVELGMTQKDLATEMSLAIPTVNQKINGIRPMSLDEAEVVATVLKIDSRKFGEYFFSH